MINKVHIFLTDKCNLKCPTCFVDANNRFENELSTQEWKNVINELNSVGVIETHVEGGEPFLRNDIAEILSRYKYLSDALIATNGTIKYNQTFYPLHNIKRLSISIESYTKEHQAAIKNNNLVEVINNLKEFRNNGFYINTNSVLNTSNYLDIEQIVSEDIKLEIPMARFAMFEIVGRALRNLQLKLNENQYKNAIDLYLDSAKKYGNKIIITLCLPAYAYKWLPNPLPDYINISVGKEPNQFAITAEGSVYPCASLINSPEHKWGNVKKNTLCEIIKNRINENHPCMSNSCDVSNCSTILLSTKFFTR